MKLKPCPFCGSKAKQKSERMTDPNWPHKKYWAAWITCSGGECGISVSGFDDDSRKVAIQRAINRWERRSE